MGTRGLIGLRLHNERYGAYNHWNSFPEMLGVEVVRFILSLNPEDLVTMIERANNVEVSSILRLLCLSRMQIVGICDSANF